VPDADYTPHENTFLHSHSAISEAKPQVGEIEKLQGTAKLARRALA